MTSWFVAETQPKAEAKAEFNLRNQGFDVYLPRIEKRRSHARKVETVRVPLFPRYLFVSAESGPPQWRSIGGTVGVSRLVGFGAEPARLSGGAVEAIRKSEEGGVVRLAQPLFLQGDRVRVREGAFADSICLFEGMQDGERVSVLMEILGRKVRVTVDELLLERA